MNWFPTSISTKKTRRVLCQISSKERFYDEIYEFKKGLENVLLYSLFDITTF